MIKEYRKLRKYTQKDMAEFLDITERQYQRIDTEQCIPRKDTLILLFKILKIPVEEQKEYIYKMWLNEK